MLNKKTFSTIALACVLTPTANANFEAEANIGLNSNYVWRGVTQSDKHPSISVGVDASNDKGFYLGTWIASVDFGDDTNIEYDLYTGYQFSSNSIDWDFGYIYYGYDGNNDLAFSEVYAKASVNNFSFAWSTLADSDASNLGFTDTNYIEAAYSLPFKDGYTFDVHAGNYDIKDASSYRDYSIGISKDNLSLTVSRVQGIEDLEETLYSLAYSISFDL